MTSSKGCDELLAAKPHQPLLLLEPSRAVVLQQMPPGYVLTSVRLCSFFAHTNCLVALVSS